MSNERQQRGLTIAALFNIRLQDGKWLVPSQTGNGTVYEVDPNGEQPTCTCHDHRDRGVKCKHMFAVEFVQTREQHRDGSTTLTRTIKVTEKSTYKQNWPIYNIAQTNEKRYFLAILYDLCRGIQEPPRAKTGRPPYALKDLVFAACYKVYSTVSTRRFQCDLDDAAAKGLIGKSPSYNRIINAMENPDLTPVLKAMILEAAKPLREVETNFAADSTGFSTCRFVRWFDIKYGKQMEEREWVKVHIMTGIKTNVVTAVEILDKNANDAPVFAPLVRTTSQSFAIKEVAADAGYSSLANMEAVERVGGTPFIAFKENATGAVGGLFAKMFHFFCYNKSDYLAHYHKRSNVESTFSMIKAKFKDSVRSKTDTAMVNEVLCKILCHNICCLIQSIFELGIEARFWENDSNVAARNGHMIKTADMIDALAWM